MAYYRKKPVVIEAIQYLPRYGFEETPDWLKKAYEDSIVTDHPHDDYYEVVTLEGLMKGYIYSYLVRGVEGELYPCRGDIFKETYEKVEEVDMSNEN